MEEARAVMVGIELDAGFAAGVRRAVRVTPELAGVCDFGAGRTGLDGAEIVWLDLSAILSCFGAEVGRGVLMARIGSERIGEDGAF